MWNLLQYCSFKIMAKMLGINNVKAMQNLMVLCLTLHEQGLWDQFAIFFRGGFFFLEEGRQLRRFSQYCQCKYQKSIFNENTPEIVFLKSMVPIPPFNSRQWIIKKTYNQNYILEKSKRKVTYPKLFLPFRGHETLLLFFGRRCLFKPLSDLGLFTVDFHLLLICFLHKNF